MARGMSRINSIDVRVQETVPRPNLSWENGSYSLDSIFRKFSLPRVIQCESVLTGDATRERSNFDFLQPMLLYNRRVCKKVMANSLNVDNRTGTMVEIGDSLLVPEDYKGWFAVLNHKTISKPVPHYRQVSQLAQSDCDTFLIGGSDHVQALQRIKKDSPPVQRNLYPGDVLRMGNMYVATTKVKTSRFSKAQKKEEKFLLCIDQNDREVLLPFESNGMFYIVRNKSKPTQVPVRQINDIILNTQLPCEVKLIFGRLPTTPCSFTGMLVLKNAYPESSAVASSIVNLRNILLEIPTDIPMKFRVAVNDNAIFENKGYQNAIQLCQEKAETYMRNIKVSQGHTDTDTVPEQREQEAAPSNALSLSQSQGTSSSTHNLPAVPAKPIPKSTALADEAALSQQPRAGRGVLRIPPKSNSPNSPQYAVPNMVTPPVPPRVPARLRSESTESSDGPPQPPPQTSKPSTLDRVVSQGFAPPLVRVNQTPSTDRQLQAPLESQGFAPPLVRINQAEGTNTKSQTPSTVSQYEEVWLDSQPVQKTPPIPPPKCALSSTKPLWRQKSITISVNDGYLTMPLYPTQSHEDSSSELAMTVSDKLNFWKTMDEDNQAVSNPVSHRAGNALSRNSSVTYSECGFKTKDWRATKEQETTDKVYENIEDLRQFRLEARNQKPWQNSSDSFDDVIYEPMYALDDLPVGASANRTSFADSGIMDDRTEQEVVDCSPAVARMSVAEVFENLKEVGVSKKTREFLKEEKVDGRLLIAFNEDNLIDTFPSISKIEIKKIGLFVKGWKPT